MPRQTMSLPFTYEGLPIEQVQIFKYLGITLHASRGMSCAVEHLCNTARRALFGVYGRCQELNIRDPAVKCMLFDAIVRPILNYCCEIWAIVVVKWHWHSWRMYT